MCTCYMLVGFSVLAMCFDLVQDRWRCAMLNLTRQFGFGSPEKVRRSSWLYDASWHQVCWFISGPLSKQHGRGKGALVFYSTSFMSSYWKPVLLPLDFKKVCFEGCFKVLGALLLVWTLVGVSIPKKLYFLKRFGIGLRNSNTLSQVYGQPKLQG